MKGHKDDKKPSTKKKTEDGHSSKKEPSKKEPTKKESSKKEPSKKAESPKKKSEQEEVPEMTNNKLDEEVPEMEEAKISTQFRPNIFANQLIPLEQLERNSGFFQINQEDQNIKNITLLTSAIQPFDQVLEDDEEWNYDILHAEIGQIVRTQYGEYYQK